MLTTRAQGNDSWPTRAVRCLSQCSHPIRWALIALLLGLGAWIVLATGGTAYAYPYIMLIPVLIAASWYAFTGALVTALTAGILMAYMPQDAALGSVQTTYNYWLRIAFYLLLGGLAGWLFHLRRRSFATHRSIARTDHPSGLANQVALDEDLEECLSSWPLASRTIAVIKVKVTDMADVIEALGLRAADELVLEMSQRLGRAVRKGSSLYRIGQDELALIVTDVERKDLDAITRRLVEVGEESLLIHQVPVRVQLAMGTAVSEDNDKPATELLRQARMALLTAVRQRRDHAHFSPTFDHSTLASLKLIARVRDGLDAQQFELHYQPKIRLSDGRVTGCEGLIRWRGDGDRLIPPGMFMPKVEQTSLIGPISYFVVQAAGAFSWHTGKDDTIAINLSVHNLHDDRIHDLLRQLVEQNGVRPERLEVEITEHALIDDLEEARSAIQRIRALGIGVSLDDFGTGFASFEYLQHLPLTGLKIDRAFVAQLADNEPARRLMACMIDVGHALDLEVTAEGVETQEQAEILRRLGCDLAQGFLYTPALPDAQYQAWCRRHAASLNHS